IHDVMVIKSHRGQGISSRMLEKVEETARQRGCCKLTLEVLEANNIARNAYQKFGFSAYELDPETGQALFWEKSLQP
ncbi:MAG TPA: GNAT family N-acetyltransferase, partial [Thiolapillus brandeum]|nr:GNAT family N-acetyltransferase [Thiolapillus brandeum]